MAAETTVPIPPEIPRHLFTVHDFERMVERGIFSAGERIELICGEIVEMATIGDRHAAAVARLTRLFAPAFGQSVPWIQNPIRLSGLSLLQPDASLLRPREDDYGFGKPGPADIFLLVEVADSSLSYHRNVKLGLYAAAGVTEVWIVDLEGQAIEVYRDPRPDGFSKKVILPRGEHLEPLAFPLLSLSVDEILGPIQR